MANDRATMWSVTINNPTEKDEEEIALARQRGWKVEGQKEVGLEGTPHYQLAVKTPQVRFSAVRKAFQRGHVEQARNAKALQTYVTKEETRVGQLPTAQDKYPSMSKLLVLLFEKFNALNYLDIDNYPTQLWRRTTSGRPILELFDDAVRPLIVEGYKIGSMCANPATRSHFKLYWQAEFEHIHLALEAQHALETKDRQTDTASESSVSVPTIEHNHANDNERTQGGLSQASRSEDTEDYEEYSCSSDEGRSEGSSYESCEDSDC